MKRIKFTTLLSLLLLISSCDNGINEHSYGEISIILPISTSRVIDLNFSKINTDTFTIYAYNETTLIKADASVGDISSTIEVAVPAGTYSVLVLAGNSYSGYVSLLGSGLVTNVTVIQDQTTNVNIVLENIDMELSAPASVQAGALINVSFSLTLNNDRLVISQQGSICLSDNVFHGVGATMLNGVYTGSVSFSAPGIPGSETLSYKGESIYLVDPAYNITGILLEKSFGGVWRLPEYWNPNSAIQSETVLPIEVLASITGIGVTIVWTES